MTSDDQIEVHVTAGPIADAVLRRLVSAVAAQGEVPIDRIHDATLIMDSLLGALATDRVSAVLMPLQRGIEIAIGPLQDGEGARILDATALPELGSVVRGLGDRVWIDTQRGPQEYLCVLVGQNGAVE
jgi:hypothetical protein